MPEVIVAAGKITIFVAVLLLVCFPAGAFADPRGVGFSKPAASAEAYDYVEIVVTVDKPDAMNPFTDASLSGTFQTLDGSRTSKVEGFCDSTDGSLYRIRFMPTLPGEYSYTVTYKQGPFERSSKGVFHATDGHRRGMIAIDPEHPWHFIWEGTGEHYFFNGATAFFLMGWKQDSAIDFSIERLHRLKANRIRVSIYGRENTFFGEPVMVGPNWDVDLAPWAGENPDDYDHPGWDYSRFNVPYWQKFERMLKFARERNMIISLILDMGDSYVHPSAGSEDEHRYIRYAVARFGAFSNITWDLGDDLDRYRDEKWAHETGTLLQGWDPYKHLETSHPTQIAHQDRASSWFGFTSYQDWSRDQHRLMLESRELQLQTGRIIPQTNEEYGYEDHYPLWAIPGSDSEDELRRTAWDIAMAGGYQTAGETARRGTNIWPDTGGGWMNGRGDDTMTLLLEYGHMVDFFTSFEWWKTNPHDELVSKGNYCLADPGRTYAVYLPNGGNVTVQLQPGRYRVYWFSALTGEIIDLPPADGPEWTSPASPDQHDWALLLQRM